jgi:hypothetical protein
LENKDIKQHLALSEWVWKIWKGFVPKFCHGQLFWIFLILNLF